MSSKTHRPIAKYLLGSLLLHFSIWSSLTLVQWLKTITPASTAPETIEVSFISAPEASSTKKEPEKLPDRQQPESLAQQIVQQSEQALNDEVPEDSRFLGRHNQRVKQQTRAAQTGAFRNTDQQPAPSEPPSPTEMKPEAPRKPVSLADLRPQFAPKIPQIPVQPVSRAPASQDSDPSLGSQSDDYLKDVPTGMQTLLSTREFVYYSYYARIRDQIRQHWEPGVREKVRIIYRSGRSPAAVRDRITQVVVTLDDKGFLVNVEVIGPSGLIELDEIAVEAFRSAAPFPNPPEGMVESDGTIKIRWDFVLEASFYPVPQESAKEVMPA